MPSTPENSDTLLNSSPSADPRQYCSNDILRPKAVSADDGSQSLVVSSEHEVVLGTAAAAASTPTFEGEFKDEDAAPEVKDPPPEAAAPSRRGWIGSLVRLFSFASDERPRRRRNHIPVRADYLTSARMAREMERL